MILAGKGGGYDSGSNNERRKLVIKAGFRCMPKMPDTGTFRSAGLFSRPGYSSGIKGELRPGPREKPARKAAIDCVDSRSRGDTENTTYRAKQHCRGADHRPWK